MTSGYDIILEIESLSQPWPKHYERVLLCTFSTEKNSSKANGISKYDVKEFNGIFKNK